MTALPANLRNVWRHLSRIDLFAIGLILGGATCAFLDLSGGLASFLKFFAIIATVYGLFRLAGWWRTRLLWSLRNRLIVAYLFIAVVPILLIVTLVVLAGQILYSQLGRLPALRRHPPAYRDDGRRHRSHCCRAWNSAERNFRRRIGACTSRTVPHGARPGTPRFEHRIFQ